MAASAAMAKPPVTDSISVRVDRLEKAIGSQSNYQVQSAIQEMHDEIQALRGTLEVTTFELQKLKELQQQQYADLDQRLKGGGAVAATGTPSISATDSGKMMKTPMAGAAVPGTATAAETKQYEAAYVMLTEQKYSAAIPALQAYIQDYPDGQYIASAYYWLGETQTIADDLGEAKKAFQTVIDKYPNSPKVVDASLKLAMVYEDGGQYDKALQLFEDVKQKFPNTPQAKLAGERIQQIHNIDR